MVQSQNPLKTGQRNTGRTHFKPGNRVNPGGRPKSRDFAGEVRDFLRETDPAKKTKTRLRSILEDLQAHKPEILLHYAFGKPVETVNIGDRLGNEVDQKLILTAQTAWSLAWRGN